MTLLDATIFDDFVDSGTIDVEKCFDVDEITGATFIDMAFDRLLDNVAFTISRLLSKCRPSINSLSTTFWIAAAVVVFSLAHCCSLLIFLFMSFFVMVLLMWLPLEIDVFLFVYCSAKIFDEIEHDFTVPAAVDADDVEGVDTPEFCLLIFTVSNKMFALLVFAAGER